MQFDQKKIKYLSISLFALNILAFCAIIFFLFFSTNTMKVETSNKSIFSYTLKVGMAYEELDKIFERAELSTNVLSDSIYNSYDTSRQQFKSYNMQFVNSLGGLIKAVLSNSPGVNGSWFQLNADFPYSVDAYTWYSFKDNIFINERDELKKTSSAYREITPEEDPYYFNAIKNKGDTWSNIYIDPDTKKAMITVSKPIYKNRVLIGVVGVDISTENLDTALNNMQSILGDCGIFLLDQSNNVILSKISDTVQFSKNSYPFLKEINRMRVQPIEYTDEFGQKTAMMLKLSNNYKIIIAVGDKPVATDSIVLDIIISALLIIVAFILGCLFRLKSVEIKLKKSSDVGIDNDENNSNDSSSNIDIEKINNAL